ncbi:MAG: DUF1499 domain-containing protein [Hyphomicrobiales bacterium]
MILKSLVALALLFAFLIGMFLLAGPENIWRRLGSVAPLQLTNWEGLSSPNWALACPKMEDGSRYCQRISPTHESPIVFGEPERIYKWLVDRIEADGYASRNAGGLRTASSINIVTRDDVALKIRFEALSPTLKFPDIIDLEVFAVRHGTSSFALLSQSVLGFDDLGLNARRLERILEDFTDIHVRD